MTPRVMPTPAAANPQCQLFAGSIPMPVIVRFVSSPYVVALLLGVIVFAGELAYYGASFH